MKNYYVQKRIGHAKYVVSHYDGIQTHNDGSAFYGIHIFKNKIKMNAFIQSLVKTGYKYRSVCI